MLRFFRHTLPWQTRFFIRDPTTVLRPAAIGNGFFTIRCSTAGHLTLHSRRILANQQKLHVSIYTRTGDKGLSSLFTGERRPKTDPVFQALGTIDELSSTIAVALAHIDEHLKIIKPTNDVANLRDQLEQIQRRLQALGSAVATPLSESTMDEEVHHTVRVKRYSHINFPDEVVSQELEKWIDEMSSQLPPLRQFTLPSGGLPGSTLHLARAVCRRAERWVVNLNAVSVHATVEPAVIRYINRLSDYLFTAARFVTVGFGYPEKHFTVPRNAKSSV